jgi:hypothetical protein
VIKFSKNIIKIIVHRKRTILLTVATDDKTD